MEEMMKMLGLKGESKADMQAFVDAYPDTNLYALPASELKARYNDWKRIRDEEKAKEEKTRADATRHEGSPKPRS